MTPSLQDATNALQQGNQGLAIGTLATVVRSEPNNETAWLMLASLLDDNAKKRHCLERVLAINPGNSQAALEWMRLQPPATISPPVQREPVAPKPPMVESVQCPKCGAPVDVMLGRESLHCTYCGAGLRITRGASGHALATLDDIKVDTSFLAGQAALARLEQRLRELQATRDQMLASRNGAEARINQLNTSSGTKLTKILLGVAAIVLAVVLLNSASGIGIVVGPFLLIFGIVTLVWPLGDLLAIRRQIHAAKMHVADMASRIDDTSREIDAVKKQRDPLAARLDNLASEL